MRHFLFAVLSLFVSLQAFAQATSRDTAFEAVLAQMRHPFPVLTGPDQQPDSAKVYPFMARYNPVYGERDAYRLGLLRLLELTQTKSEDSRYLYDSLLLELPNHVIQHNDMPLYHKLLMGDVLQPDTALEAAQLLYRASRRTFQEWIQVNYWAQLQTFSSTDDLEEVIAGWRANGISERWIAQARKFHALRNPAYAGVLLEKMTADTALHDFVYPVALWSRLKNHPADVSLQAQTIEGFRQLSTLASRRGNADRYAMLCYQLMLAQHASKAADTLLALSMRHLHQEVDDTTNTTRRAASGLLAYGYYLQYQAAKDNAPDKALQYLAYAARFSPRSQTGRNIIGNYNQVALGDDAKESYRDDFAKALLEKGDDKAAMKVLAEQVNASPEEALAFKALFEAKFPQGDFAGFFNAHVRSSWAMAPDFKLQTADGQTRQLSDYRGKWLLLDFWGTWCTPCREELPALNDFAARIANDSIRAFLSIDCADTKAILASFLSNNHYTFPVVLSNGQIEKDYSIKGYPSKFLVAPDGRMLPLALGAPWESILSQFISIQHATPPARPGYPASRYPVSPGGKLQ